MTQHDRQCRMLGCRLFLVLWSSCSRPQGTQSRAHAVCPLQIVGPRSTLSSTSTAEVWLVVQKFPRWIRRSRQGSRSEFQTGFNFQRQRAGAMAQAKPSDAAKVKCLDLRQEGRKEE